MQTQYKKPRNSGRLIKADFTKKSNQQKDEDATLFSEGSQELKDLLLYMWNNGINTYACCAGHKRHTFEFDGKKVVDKCRQYIFFDVSSFSKEELEILMLAVLTDKQKILVSFTFTLDNMGRKNGQRVGLGFHFDINCKSNFVYMLNLLKTIKNGQINKLKYLPRKKELNKDYMNFLLAALKIFKYDLIENKNAIMLKLLYLKDGLYIHCVDEEGKMLKGKYSAQKLKLAIDVLCDKNLKKEK